MQTRTHIVIGLAIALYFLPYINHKVLFLPIVLLASLLPDIDSSYSYLGSKPYFRPLQFFASHRGFIHSYTLCIFLLFILIYFYPPLGLPFFLGYSFHLFADSFTIEGIAPFWPFKANSNGIVSTGGVLDNTIFSVFAIIDIALVIFFALRLF